MGYRFSDVFVRRDGTENIYSFDENRFREIENAHWTSFKESLREEGIEERTNEWNTRMQEEGSRLEEIERGFLNVTRKASLLNGIQQRIDDEYRARRKTERSDFDGQLNSLRRFSHLYSDAKSYPELQHVNWNNFNQFISRVDGIFNVEQGGEITPEKKEQLEEFLRYVEVVNKAEEYLTPPEVDRALAGRMLASLNGPQEKLTFRGQPISPEITTGKIIDYTDSEGRKTGPFFPVVMEEKNAVGVVIARTVYLLPYTGEVPVGETTVLSDSGVQKWAVPAVRLSYSINGSTEALTTVTEYQSDQEGRIISSSYNVINGEKISGSEKQQEVRSRDVSLFESGENSSSVIRTLGYSEQVEEPNVSQSIATVAESVSVEMAQMNGMGGIQNG